MDISTAIQTTTQPVVIGVAGASVMGFTLNDFIVIGTALLLVVNLCLGVYSLVERIRRKKTDGD